MEAPYKKQPVYTVRLDAGYTVAGCRGRVDALLDAAGLAEMAAGRETVLIKPNLVGTHAPPVTTPAPLVAAIALYLKERCPAADVIVGDGTGALEYDTWRCFDELGYTALAGSGAFTLTDLNEEPLVRLARRDLSARPEFYIPGVVVTSLLVSVPVLKAHTLAGVTLTMKNMIGTAPPSHYQCGGHWKKSSFHERMHESIFEINQYRTPDLTVLDATAGMKDAHLWGALLDPPPGLIAACTDPVAIDAFGSGLLGIDHNGVRHIAMADGVLGSAETSGALEV